MAGEDKISTFGTLSDSEIKALCSEGRLIVEDYCEKNVKQACYELRAGKIYYDLNDPITRGKRHVLKDNEFILIKPKQQIVIITQEKIELDPDILGRILTKGVLFSIGLSPVNTYADPGFYGRLGIVLHNVSNDYLRISPGEPIAKIEFSRLATPVRERYRGQHGYETGLWPIPEEMIVPYEEARKDPRVKSIPEEIEYSYGKDLGAVMNRVFAYERRLLILGIAFFLFALVLLYSIQGTTWGNLVTGIAIGVVAALIALLVVYLATNLRIG